MINRTRESRQTSLWGVDGILNFYFFTSSKNSLIRRGSNVRYINPLCKVCEDAKSNGSIRRRTCRVLVHPCRFLAHRQICRLWLNLTAWNSQKNTDNYVTTVCISFFRSNFIFSKKRSKVFFFEGPPEARYGERFGTSLFSQELYLHGKYELE